VILDPDGTHSIVFETWSSGTGQPRLRWSTYITCALARARSPLEVKSTDRGCLDILAFWYHISGAGCTGGHVRGINLSPS